MTNQRLIRLTACTDVLLQCFVFLSLKVLFSFLPIQYTIADFWRIFIVALWVILSYISRIIHKTTGYFVINIVIFIGSVISGKNEIDIFFNLIMAVLLLVFSAKIVTGSIQNETVSKYYSWIMIADYIIGCVMHQDMLISFSKTLFALFLITLIISSHLKKLKEIFLQNGHKEDFPSEQILKVNMFTIFLGIIFFMLGIFLFYNSIFADLLHSSLAWLCSWILKFMRQVIKFKKNEIVENPTEEISTEDQTDELDLDIPAPGNIENGLNWIFIVFSIAIVMLILWALICVVSKTIRRIKRKKVMGMDTIEYLEPGILHRTEKKSKLPVEAEKEENRNSKYRKIYKKKVKKGMKQQKIPLHLTPALLTKEAIIIDDEKADRITKSYEKARYSKEEVTQSEINEIKNMKRT